MCPRLEWPAGKRVLPKHLKGNENLGGRGVVFLVA